MHTSSSCLPFTHVHRIRSGLLLHSSNRDNISLSNRMHMFRLATKHSYIDLETNSGIWQIFHSFTCVRVAQDYSFSFFVFTIIFFYNHSGDEEL